MSRILNLNGEEATPPEPTPQPKNIDTIQQLARNLYGSGKKFEGIGAICDAIKLLSNGVKRCFMDNQELANAAKNSNESILKRLKIAEERLDIMEGRK